MTLLLPRLFLRRLFVGGLLLLAAAGLRAAEAAPVQSAAAEPAVELPKFEVTDSRVLPPPESWRYASVPGYEILSSISARETTRFVKDFYMLQAGVEAIMPGFATPDVAVPTSLILAGRNRSFDRFFSAEQTGARERINGLFYPDAERGAIIVDFARAELILEDATSEEADPYRAFYTAYFHHLVSRATGGKAPAWFEEGLVQLFAQIDVNKKWINFAQIGDGFGGPRDGDFNRRLAQHALIPLDKLLKDEVTERGTFWEAQCYAFVHMCLYGRGQKYQKGFIKFITRQSNETITEAMFKECFGRSFKDMNMELRGYVDFTDYKSMQYTAKKGQALPDAPAFTLRDASEAEVGRILGTALRLAGHNEDAHNMLIAPYIRGQSDPQLLASLGLDERLAGRDDRARKFLEAASKQKVDRPRAYLELAKLRLDEATAKPAADGKLSRAQLDTVLEPLQTALKQRPPMAAVYGTIADAWSRSQAAPTLEEFRVVLQGVQTFPRNGGLVLQAAILAVSHNFTKEARLLVAHGLKISRDEAMRSRFEVLAQAIERDAAPAAPAPAPAPAKPADASYLPKLQP